MKTENSTDLDTNNSNLDYVKVENKSNSQLESTDKINTENINVTNEVISKTTINDNFNVNVVENKKVELKKITDSNIINEISNIDQTSNRNETSAISNERIPK